MAEPGTQGPSPLQRHFTEPTTPYWQSIVSADPSAAPGGPWQFGYPARLPDGRVLRLPIRQLGADPTQAVASLLVNHAAMPVVQALGEMLAQALGPYKPDLLVGLPTLGLSLAPIRPAAMSAALASCASNLASSNSRSDESPPVRPSDGVLVFSVEKKRFSSRPSSNMTGSEPVGVPPWNALTGPCRNRAKPEPQILTSG